MEIIVQDAIVNHMKVNNLFRSSLDSGEKINNIAVINGSWGLKINLRSGMCVAVIYMYFIKAFEKVPRKRLIRIT